MARIAGVELDDKNRVVYALTSIKGIGWSMSKSILDNLGIDESTRVKELSSDDVSKIASKVEERPIEGDLTRQVKANINRLKRTGSYRGSRHQKNLPARGQRTKTNARTKRGKRRTVGAFKKEALTKVKKDTKEEK